MATVKSIFSAYQHLSMSTIPFLCKGVGLQVISTLDSVRPLSESTLGANVILMVFVMMWLRLKINCTIVLEGKILFSRIR